ncbi:MAG: dihydroneopterin aldolase [bacterium]|nr:dihydroneopterin aldolase [bacterium]
MHKILINKLIIDGIHGLTEKERHMPQRFQVDIVIQTRSKAYLADSINDTFDYRVAKRIATEIIQNESFFLLETIAHRIAEEILKQDFVDNVTVSVHKLDIWGNAIPGVSVSKMKMSNHLDLVDFDIEELVEQLALCGGVSLPIIPERRRYKLIEEALSYQYQKQPEVVGGGKVREQLSSVKEFLDNSLFVKFRNDFIELIIRKLASLEIKDLFVVPINFNDMSLQKYEVGSVGITPHKDGKSRINLVCVFNLIGKAEFALCNDRSGSNSKFLDTTPGNVIIMRAPGFFHSTFQPFHFVRNITEERIVFGLRQKSNTHGGNPHGYQ